MNELRENGELKREIAILSDKNRNLEKRIKACDGRKKRLAELHCDHIRKGFCPADNNKPCIGQCGSPNSYFDKGRLRFEKNKRYRQFK